MEEVKRQSNPNVKAKYVKHLVVDTGAIIHNINLHNIADNYYAPQDVIRELRSAKAKAALQKLPFEIIIREPSTEAMKVVIDNSKKTGDFKSLSLPDMKVIALTYDLHKQYDVKSTNTESPVQSSDADVSEVAAAVEEKLNIAQALAAKSAGSAGEGDQEDSTDESDDERMIPEGFCEDVDSDDDEGWITEDNLMNALKKMGAFEIDEGCTVGCLTTDFALQNVLLHMHLSLVSLTGLRIKKLKSFVLRCRSCYQTTSNMDKEFCPTCGHKSLHKCAVSVNDKGEQELHIDFRRLYNKRGMQYNIPAPKGGKHAVNERLFEDQRMPHNRMARVRADPLEDGPFSMHDVTSRSAILGLRTYDKKVNSRRNPNERKVGSRRK